ncbi:MAG: hypothetical protein EOP05_01600 [Proteobacteria bacterium]|nr:MAG: hypothetical protein EOP05_01600 [Pseudomonadota bacterium]
MARLDEGSSLFSRFLRLSVRCRETSQIQAEAKIENDCKALSTKDTLEVLGDKISDAFEYGGREVATGKAGCADLDLPCSAVPTKRVGTYTLRSHNLTLVRKNGGQRYYIKASTRWDLDLPQPQIDIQLDSRYCR